MVFKETKPKAWLIPQMKTFHSEQINWKGRRLRYRCIRWNIGIDSSESGRIFGKDEE
jgi:hypothetical protein